MLKKVSIKTINNKNKTRKTLLNVFMLTFIMFVISMSTVYALSYTVSYNNNGGSGTMSDSTYTSNPGTLRTNTFTKNGYKFMGWNKNSSATSDWYRDTNSFTGTDGSSTTLYAQWCKNSQGTIKISNNEVKDTYGNYVFRNNKYITVKADNKSMTYGATAPSYSYTVTGTLNGEAGVTGTASYTIKDGSNNTVSNIRTASVGTYSINVSGLSAASGYVIQNNNAGTLTINRATATINASNKTATYTGSGIQIDPATVTLVNNETYTGTIEYKYWYTDNCSTSVFSSGSYPVNVGTYSVSVSIPQTTNYNSASKCVTLTINPADNPTTISAVTGLNHESTGNMVTVANKQGTVYYNVGTELTSSNYNNNPPSGTSTTIPTVSSRDAGTYTVYYYIPASGNYKAKSGSVSVTIGKVTCPAPSGVAITTAGRVTWTGSTNTNCTKYKISANNSSFTNDVTSGYNYLSTINAATGTRYAYVRAYSTDTTNYSESTSASKSVTVYAITFASNNTNYGTVSPTSYNVISGATVETSGNNLLVKGVTSGTTTTTLTTVTPSPKTGYLFSSWSKTSGSLTSTQTITATFVEANYQNTTANTYHMTLKDALSGASNNQTIKVLKDTTETLQATNSKTGIKLDLNGKTITSSASIAISNNSSSSIDIYNTSSTTGVITGSGSSIITGGTVTVNGTSTTNPVQIINTSGYTTSYSIGSVSNLTVNSNSTIQGNGGYGIYNRGTATITGGSITGGMAAIDNGTGNTVTITGGTINCQRDAISNAASGTINISGADTTIAGEYGRGIYTDGTVIVTGGTIVGAFAGVYVDTNGALTLGIDDSTVSTSSPVIQANGTPDVGPYFDGSEYGVYNVGTFNFYDGRIKAVRGTSKTIKNTASDISDNYSVYTETISGVGHAYLAKLITIKADNKSMTYGGSAPTYTYTITGVVSGETAVTGTATYTVKSGNTTISDLTTADAGTYTISVSGLSATNGYVIQNTNTGTLTINPQQCTAPTDVAISTAGRVTWTASSNENCNKYKISINNSTFTDDVTSGHNYLSTIIAGTGTRYAYVRAYSDDSNYAESTSETATATVYTITFASNNTNYGTVSPTSYNVISGATVTTSSNNLLIKGVTTGSTTATIATITPTANATDHYDFKSWSKTSGSLTSAQTITATFGLQTFLVQTSNGSSVTQSSWSYYTVKTTYSFWNGSGPYCYSCSSINPITGKYSYSGTRTRSTGCRCSTSSSSTSSSGTTSGVKIIGSVSSSNCSGSGSQCKKREEPKLATCSSASNCFIEKTYGSTIGTLPTATKTGYTFDGWWTASSGGTQVQSTDVITSATTIYAHWIANTYTVTADTQGGNISETTGWTIDTVSYDNLIVNSGLVVNSASPYTWTFSLQSGAPGETASINYTCGSSGPLVIDITSGTGTIAFASVCNLTIDSLTIGEDVYSINETINFDADINSSSDVSGPNHNFDYGSTYDIATKTVTYNSTYGTLPVTTKTAFNFVEWNTKADGSGTTVTSTKTVSTAANHTIYAIWEEKSYNVSFLKTDQHTRIPLPGVQFTLTGTNYDGETISLTATSNSVGEVSFTVPVGEYEIVETQTIEGYHLDEKIIYVSVVDDEEEGD